MGPNRRPSPLQIADDLDLHVLLNLTFVCKSTRTALLSSNSHTRTVWWTKLAQAGFPAKEDEIASLVPSPRFYAALVIGRRCSVRSGPASGAGISVSSLSPSKCCGTAPKAWSVDFAFFDFAFFTRLCEKCTEKTSPPFQQQAGGDGGDVGPVGLTRLQVRIAMYQE